MKQAQYYTYKILASKTTYLASTFINNHQTSISVPILISLVSTRLVPYLYSARVFIHVSGKTPRKEVIEGEYPTLYTSCCPINCKPMYPCKL